MSMALAIVHQGGAVVGSDGRLFSSVPVVDGVAQAQVEVLRDDFNKTFSAMDDKVIGACTGLMFFSGSTICEHAAQTVNHAAGAADFVGLVDSVRDEFCQRLQNLNPLEVSLNNLKLWVTLASRASFTHGAYQTIALFFTAEDGHVVCTPSALKVAAPRQVMWHLSGDHGMLAAADPVLQATPRGRSGRRFLLGLAENVLERGIAHANNHEYGNMPAAGGTLFYQTL